MIANSDSREQRVPGKLFLRSLVSRLSHFDNVKSGPDGAALMEIRNSHAPTRLTNAIMIPYVQLLSFAVSPYACSVSYGEESYRPVNSCRPIQS
jgi:hypothetical protein